MDVSFAPSAVVSPLSFRGQASFSFPFFSHRAFAGNCRRRRGVSGGWRWRLET